MASRPTGAEWRRSLSCSPGKFRDAYEHGAARGLGDLPDKVVRGPLAFAGVIDRRPTGSGRDPLELPARLVAWPFVLSLLPGSALAHAAWRHHRRSELSAVVNR